MKAKLRRTLEVLFCIIIFAFLISKIDVKETLTILKEVNLFWIFIGIGISIFSTLITGYSLKVLFDSVKRIPFLEWMRYYLIGFSMGLILPGRAGDFSIIYFVKEKGFDIGESTALTVIDKLITLIIFGTIAAIGVFTIFNSSQLYLGLALTLFCIVGGLSLFTGIGRRFIRKIIGKYAEKFKGFNRTFKNLIQHHKDKIAINIIITLYRPIGNTLLMVVVLKALGIGDLSFFYLMIINAITLIVSLIPLTPNGLGIREGVGTLLFSAIGVTAEATVAMYVILLMINYTAGILGATYYLLTKKV